jgi:hypothetical protein
MILCRRCRPDLAALGLAALADGWLTLAAEIERVGLRIHGDRPRRANSNRPGACDCDCADMPAQAFVAVTLKCGKLTFQCGSGVLAYDARQAMDAGRDFTVTLTPPEGVKDVTGKLLRSNWSRARIQPSGRSSSGA